MRGSEIEREREGRRHGTQPVKHRNDSCQIADSQGNIKGKVSGSVGTPRVTGKALGRDTGWGNVRRE